MDSHSPHAYSTREYTPSQAQSISASPPSLGLGNRPDQEVLELRSWCWTLSGRIPLPRRLLHLERVLHTGQTTCFLQLDFQHSRATTRLHMKIQWSSSHTQSSTARPQQSTGNTDTGFPKTGDRQMLQHKKAQQLWGIRFSPTNNTGQTHG
jgi:hypothetical protein